jgi:hypothetical protein
VGHRLELVRPDLQSVLSTRATEVLVSRVLDHNLDAVQDCKVDGFDRVEGCVDSHAVRRDSSLVASPNLGLLRSEGVEETRLAGTLFPVETVVEWDISDAFATRRRKGRGRD